MKSFFVTGGAGFIGNEFVRQAIAAGRHVVVLDKLTYAGNPANLQEFEADERLTFVRGDISDRELIERLLVEHECQGIVNFAAETHVDRSIGSPDDFVQTNINGTFELLEASLSYYKQLSDSAKEQFRLLHVSTDEVYGSLGDQGYFTEDTPYSPNSPYSASKASSDHFVRAYGHTYGLPVLITNCSNNYGPRQFPEKLIPLIIRRAYQGESLPVYGKGENVRDWLHVEDHCRALLSVLERGRPGETYNIGGGAELSNIDVVTTICHQIDQQCPSLSHRPCSNLIRYVTDRPGHDFRYAIDCSKIREELGWEPQVSFEQGILQTIQWYLANLEWVDGAMKRAAYKGERLGLIEEKTELTQEGDSLGADDINQPIEGVTITSLRRYSDERGWLLELFRDDELDEDLRPRMSYLSETSPGVTRGPHEHVEQTDIFAFVGPGDMKLYLWDSRSDSKTCGNRIVRLVGESHPCAVIIPPGVVHAYKNISKLPARVINSPNRLYGGEGRNFEVDEIRHENLSSSPYVVQ